MFTCSPSRYRMRGNRVALLALISGSILVPHQEKDIAGIKLAFGSAQKFQWLDGLKK
jgi:hypothetical protein